MEPFKLYILLTLLIALSTFSGCSNNDDDIIWDIVPASVSIMVVDKDRNNLLSPNNEHNILDNKIVATHLNKEYTIQTEEIPKAIMPKPLGLRLYNWLDNNEIEIPTLNFGEFHIPEKYKKETVTIDWGNEKIDVIDFAFQLKWKKRKPNVVREIWLNGEKLSNESNSVTIVMEEKYLK